MNLENIYDVVNSTSNMLRGMTFDETIPSYTRDVMHEKIQVLEKALEEIYDELESKYEI